MADQLVVIGTSPYSDVSVTVGPFRLWTKAKEASDVMEEKGWVTEISWVTKLSEVETIVNDEGADEDG